MEYFAKILKRCLLSQKNYTLDVWQGYEYILFRKRLHLWCLTGLRIHFCLSDILDYQKKFYLRSRGEGKMRDKMKLIFHNDMNTKKLEIISFFRHIFQVERNIIKLREKRPFLEFFWSIFSRIRTLKTQNMNAFHPVFVSLSQVGVPVK